MCPRALTYLVALGVPGLLYSGVASPQSPQSVGYALVQLDSAVMADARAQLALESYHPVVIERRYWSYYTRPGDTLSSASIRVAGQLLHARPALADTALACPPSVVPQPALSSACRLRGSEALIALGIPERLGDTIRHSLTAVLAERGHRGRPSEVTELMVWLVPSGDGFRLVRRQFRAP